VKLIYIDPPFDSKADYKKKIELRGANATSDASAFEEKQYTDIWNNDEYLQFMYERLILMRELLAEDGSIYVHCDHGRDYLMRSILDEVFGPDNCHNVISWKRSHAQGNSGQGAKHFGRTTDSIIIYSKSLDPIWNYQYTPYSEEVLIRDYKYSDEKGQYRLMPVDGPGGASKGNPHYTFLGVTGYWRYSEKTMQALYDTGEILLSSTGKSLSRKKYLSDADGTPLTDFWDDANRISPTSNERLDYPTQKPEVLLERIIKTGSNPGDIVFDCFMGSGTTQAVALKLGRRFLGADINLGAIQTTSKRLLNVSVELIDGSPELKFDEKGEQTKFYTGFEVYTVNHYDFFRNELEARELLIEALELQKLPGNMLWDGEKDGWMVKILAVNRLATAADLNPILGNLDYKTWERRSREHPDKPVERIRFVCMGHDPDLKAQFLDEMAKIGFRVELEVLDILRDRKELQFKREAEAKIVLTQKKLEIKSFYPMNLLQKLSLERAKVGEWRELVDSVLIDWNYDGAVFSPSLSDIPDKNTLVKGTYDVPNDAGTIRVKITDLIAESWEGNVEA
jgi:site-specific DNA-methyltransferase (adenine-specific)/adenine-specific DNA-methyltransferase